MAEKKTQSSAKSTSSKASGQTPNETAEQATKALVSEEVLAKLPEPQKKFIEELEASQSGGTGKSYRLSDPNTQYVDVETGWTLAGEQAKPLPKGHSAETLARVKEGFLVESTSTASAAVEPITIVAAGTEEAKARAQEQAKAEAKSSEKEEK